ncbi:hypothetical protein [Aureispira sp. CCB-E]|uniref:hypothetical protein n=1 Tax=Aureispira sp. CCB-E TaxID=3051121 RepID=UPI002868DFB4|nr:hypothetical protein [Aureispira sp. CCB-E]WMX14018.1 hypothetical protein QP953_24495 [Aureispira sp. CCB-E]
MPTISDKVVVIIRNNIGFDWIITIVLQYNTNNSRKGMVVLIKFVFKQPIMEKEIIWIKRYACRSNFARKRNNEGRDKKKAIL